MPELSIVIAAYNEEKRLPPTILKIMQFLRERSISFEMVIVNDGSKDKTKEVVEQLSTDHPEIRLLSHFPNWGRGVSIREGMLAAHGTYILETDADGSVALEAIERFFNTFRADTSVDVIIGSREMKDSVITYPQPFLRVFLGYGFIYITKFLFWAWHIHDFTLGFKMIKHKAVQDIFKHQFDNHFVAEAEIVYVSLKRGWKLVELPVTWSDDRDSRVRPIRDSFRSLRGLIQLFARNTRGMYRNRI